MTDQANPSIGLEVADPASAGFASPPAIPAASPAKDTAATPAPTNLLTQRKDSAPTAEEMSYGMAGLSAATTPVPTSTKPRKSARFVASERETAVPLSHPVECEDVVYERIVVRRLNVSDYIAHFAKPGAERGRFPCFFDDRGEPVPEEVLDALSLDDSTVVNEAYQHFLPASFRGDREP